MCPPVSLGEPTHSQNHMTQSGSASALVVDDMCSSLELAVSWCIFLLLLLQLFGANILTARVQNSSSDHKAEVASCKVAETCPPSTSRARNYLVMITELSLKTVRVYLALVRAQNCVWRKWVGMIRMENARALPTVLGRKCTDGVYTLTLQSSAVAMWYLASCHSMSNGRLLWTGARVLHCFQRPAERESVSEVHPLHVHHHVDLCDASALNRCRSWCPNSSLHEVLSLLSDVFMSFYRALCYKRSVRCLNEMFAH